MKYYRLSKGTDVKYAQVPSDFWLPLAEFVCFNPEFDGTMDGLEELYDLIADDEDDPEFDFSELPETKYDTCVELSQSEYRKLTGGIEKTDYYYRNDDEPYYEGEMPEGWYDEAQQALLPSSYWCDNFGWNDDWEKVKEEMINNFCMFECLVGFIEAVDIELETEAYDRWIYAHALEAMGETDKIKYRNK